MQYTEFVIYLFVEICYEFFININYSNYFYSIPMNTNTSSWGKSKLVLLGSIMFLSSFFFGGQANAAFCFWTATGTSAVNFSSTTVWKDAGGTTCDPSANTATFQGASSTTNIDFDVSTTTQGIYIDSAYTGVISVSSSVTVTSTGAVFAQGGTAGVFNVASGGTLVVNSDVNVSSTASFLVDGTLKVGGNLIVTSTLLSTSGTVTFTSSTAQSISGPGSITFYVLNVTSGANTVTAGSSVTSTGGITVASGNIFALGANNLVVSSSINNSGVITQSSAGTVTMSGTGNLGGTGNTTLFNLVINGTTTFSNTVTTTNILTINSGKVLNAGTSTIVLTSTSIPFVVNGTFSYASSTVIYSGVGGSYISATSSYYNLTINSTDAGVTSLTASVYVYGIFTINNGAAFYGGSNDIRLYSTGTPFVNNGTFTIAYSMVSYRGSTANITAGTYFNLYIDAGSTSTLAGNVTSTNYLWISSGASLNAGSATIRLTGAGGAATVFYPYGTFNAGTSEVIISNAVSSTFRSASFYNLTLGTGNYTLASNTIYAATTTNSFTNNGTLTLTGVDLIVTGDLYNNGTTTYSSTGKLKKAATGGLTDTSFTSGSTNGTGNSVTVSVTDPASNMNASTIETKSISLFANTYSDSESVTLTETGAGTGIFSGSIPFNITNGATSNSKMDVSGNGSLTLTYSNDYGFLTGSGTSASFTGSIFSSGGTGGGGGSAPAVTSATAAVSVSTGAQTTSQIVSLNLSATNVTQMAISEDPGFAGASWDTYAPTKSFTLSSGVGEKTIYVKFRSASGGVTPVYTVKITLKDGYVAAPTLPSVTGETSCEVLVAGDMVKSKVSPIIYAVNADQTKSYFPQGDIYKSWTSDNKYSYKLVNQSCISALNSSTAVMPRPGTYLVKEQASDVVYAVLPGNKLVAVSAEVATALYGSKYLLMPAKNGHTITMNDPSWTFYQQLQPAVAPAKMTEKAPVEGALVKVGSTYYVIGANKTLNEVTTNGLKTNRFQTKFAHTLTSTAGYTVGTVKVEAEDMEMSDRTQSLKKMMVQ